MTTSKSLVMRKVDDLTQRPNNEKVHTDAQVASLADSIVKFGFNDPVEITPEGEIISGEGRWLAAKKLGMTEIPCILIEGLTAEEVRGYGIAVNQTMLATGLDMDKVASEFERLAVEEEEYEAIGFSVDEAVFMLPEQRSILDDDSIGSPYMDTDTWSDLIPKVVRSKITFDDGLQQARFEQFLERLRSLYPNEATQADRLTRFVREHCPSEQAL